MKRLTKRDEKGYYVDDPSIYPDERNRGRVVKRLAAYENTGLTPKEILRLIAQMEVKK